MSGDGEYNQSLVNCMHEAVVLGCNHAALEVYRKVEPSFPGRIATAIFVSQIAEGTVSAPCLSWTRRLHSYLWKYLVAGVSHSGRTYLPFVIYLQHRKSIELDIEYRLSHRYLTPSVIRQLTLGFWRQGGCTIALLSLTWWWSLEPTMAGQGLELAISCMLDENAPIEPRGPGASVILFLWLYPVTSLKHNLLSL